MAALAPDRDLLAWLAQRRLLVADGAMGTMLLEAGLSSGGAPELWNVDRPDVVTGILTAYREAGAELLYANTFGGSPLKLSSYGLEGRCEELNRAAARIAREAAGDEALVVASIGPTGALMEPFGPLTPQAARDGYARQASALVEAGVDALSIETMSDIDEAVSAVVAVAGFGLPVMATMTFERTPRGYFTIMGVDVQRAATRLVEAGADVIGANCGAGSSDMVDLVAELAAATDVPIVVRANAGLPVMKDGVVTYPESAEEMASFVPRLVGAGARIVGGCCGSTPAHVSAMAEEVRRARTAG